MKKVLKKRKKSNRFVILILLSILVLELATILIADRDFTGNVISAVKKIVAPNSVKGANEVSWGVLDTISQNKISQFLTTRNILPEELILEKVIEETNNKKFVYYTQTYEGIPVYNSRNVFYIKDNNLIFSKLSYHKISNINVDPRLTNKDAFSVVEKDFEKNIDKRFKEPTDSQMNQDFLIINKLDKEMGGGISLFQIQKRVFMMLPESLENMIIQKYP